MNIIFYISGHGFGHATRMIAVMKALYAKEPTTHIYARTRVPERLFGDLNRLHFHYEDVALDVGVVEKDLFSQDVYSTLSRYSEISTSQNRLVEAEMEFVRKHAIDIIVSDIPPLASEIGERASIPTIAIGNFSWDFIYGPYIHSCPSFAHLINEIRTSYEKTDMLLRLPLHHEMTAFPRYKDIPLISRKCTATCEEIRERLRIEPDDQRSIVLVALRMYDLVPPRAIKEIVESGEFIVVSFAPLPFETKDSVIVLDDQWQPSEFPDILNISNVVVSKLGYGIVSECVAHETPLMYIPRDDFSEYEVLRAGLKELLPSYLMPKDDFLHGQWYCHMKTFLATSLVWPKVRTDGAEVAAEFILSYTG